MIALLTAAVATLSVIALLNIVLTMAVIRKLRRHQAALSTMAPLSSAPGIAVGSELPDFRAVAHDGELLRQDLRGRSVLVAFAAPGCSGCEATRPQLLDLLDAHRRRGGTGVVVLAADLGDTGDLVDRFAPRARVVVESPGRGSLQDLFEVVGYPAYAMINEDGRVSHVSDRLDTLPVMSPTGS